MSQLQARSPHVMVVAGVDHPKEVPVRFGGVPNGTYDDFALVAARVCEAAAAVVLLSNGGEMREVGSHRQSHDPRLYTLASIPIAQGEGVPVGLLYVLDPVQRILTPSAAEMLQALARQIASLYKLRFQNATDSLTGLANRRVFEVHLAQEIERSRRYGSPLSLLMIDVDDFKSYNDAFGHPAADEVLRCLARLLSGSARASDLTARYGGEEFAVIVPESEVHGALFLAERCRSTIEAAHWPHRGVSISVGVASMPPCTKDGDDLIGAADRALYQAKRQGGNRLARASHAWFKTERWPNP